MNNVVVELQQSQRTDLSSVTFVDNGTPIGTVNVTGSTAVLTITSVMARTPNYVAGMGVRRIMPPRLIDRERCGKINWLRFSAI
jgi:hypothetical protein